MAVKKKVKKKKKAAEPGVTNGQLPVRQETSNQTIASETLKLLGESVHRHHYIRTYHRRLLLLSVH